MVKEHGLRNKDLKNVCYDAGVGQVLGNDTRHVSRVTLSGACHLYVPVTRGATLDISTAPRWSSLSIVLSLPRVGGMRAWIRIKTLEVTAQMLTGWSWRDGN